MVCRLHPNEAAIFFKKHEVRFPKDGLLGK